ncbi:MAG: lactate utilization protein [Bryobacteraceae bacterium]|nr:lactate utilization protein [Bryobacteraceae bacterium]
MARDHILHKVRTAIGRSAGQAPAEPPPVMLHVREWPQQERIHLFSAALERLAGKTFVAASPEEARKYAADLIAAGSAVASNAPFLRECGIAGLENVRTGIHDPNELRNVCASAGVGVTSADYALADTGTLVMLASPAEARVVSLLPPVHLAVVPASRLLTGLDELFSILPDPSASTSSMVLITGPSRTADIEQILVRGVHGPGEIHVVLVLGC